jgi:hypothetical protein
MATCAAVTLPSCRDQTWNLGYVEGVAVGSHGAPGPPTLDHLPIGLEERLNGDGRLDRSHQGQGEGGHAVVAHVPTAPGQRRILGDHAGPITHRQ